MEVILPWRRAGASKYLAWYYSKALIYFQHSQEIKRSGGVRGTVGLTIMNFPFEFSRIYGM
jgi:hypothetical protein